ncbi:hypothetical protein KC723_01190 [Candidatus Kaiserbacteria bacterium]|nr:hypothetical protein [Candidatus Kaiserbacteria bacterium]
MNIKNRSEVNEASLQAYQLIKKRFQLSKKEMEMVFAEPLNNVASTNIGDKSLSDKISRVRKELMNSSDIPIATIIFARRGCKL